jgi:hypothetical protein
VRALGCELEALECLAHVAFKVCFAVFDAHQESVSDAEVPGHVGQHLERLDDACGSGGGLESVAPSSHVPSEMTGHEGELAPRIRDDDAGFGGPTRDAVLVGALEASAHRWSGRTGDPFAAAAFRTQLAHAPHVGNDVVDLAGEASASMLTWACLPSRPLPERSQHGGGIDVELGGGDLSVAHCPHMDLGHVERDAACENGPAASPVLDHAIACLE